MTETVDLSLPQTIIDRLQKGVRDNADSIWDLADAARDAFKYFRSRPETQAVPEILIWIAVARASGNYYSQEWFKKKASVARAFPAPRTWPYGYYEYLIDLPCERVNVDDPEPGTREHCLLWLEAVREDDEFDRVPGVTQFIPAYRQHILGQNLIPAEDAGAPSLESVADHILDAQGYTNPFGAFVWGMERVRANLLPQIGDPRVARVDGLIAELKEALPACLEALGMRQEVDVDGR